MRRKTMETRTHEEGWGEDKGEEGQGKTRTDEEENEDEGQRQEEEGSKDNEGQGQMMTRSLGKTTRDNEDAGRGRDQG